MTQSTALAAILTTTLAMPALAQQGAPVEQGPKNAAFEPAWEMQTRAPAIDSGTQMEVSEVATGLEHPWGIEVLPDGGYLVTERPGRLRVIDADGNLREAPVGGVPAVMAQGQGGLLDVKLADDFAESGLLFLSYAKPVEGGKSATAVARAVLNDDRTELTEVEDVFVQSPAYANGKHFGSRVVQKDDHLYITTGERSDFETRDYAQHLDKTYGKVVRVTLEGEPAEGNPFAGQADADPAIFTYGHRNVQGADIRPGTGDVWTLEHGPKGGDELNRLEAGTNYGWPMVSYGIRYSGQPIGSGQARDEEFAEPRYYWDPVIAPGGFAFYDGEMFEGWQGDVLASSLYPGGLVRLTLEGDRVTGEERFVPQLGRVRDVEIDADGAILVITDRKDGGVHRLTPGTQG